MLRFAVSLALLAAWAAATAQTAINYDNTSCSGCHISQASQPDTPMGSAMELPGANLVLEAHPSLRFHMGVFTWTVVTHDNRSTYTVSDGTNSLSLPIYYAFGAGTQTWVFEYQGAFYESLVSYYAGKHALGITTGDEQLRPQTLVQAMGRRLSTMDVNSCFACHSTNSVSHHKLTLDTLHPGLSCSHCHQGALQHAQEAAVDNFSQQPPSLKYISAASMASFCGQCHRSFSTVVRNGWLGKMDVRFQPYRMELSQCFIGTDPRISCIACHDPHKNLDRRLVDYDSKCLACHAPDAKPTIVGKARVCPVAKSHCVSCHMPRIELPGNHGLYFRDHDIRVVKTGEPYPD